MRDILYLRTMAQLRALVHPLRLAIVRALQTAGEPRSATQLGKQLGETASKLHYHLVEMARHGIIRLVRSKRRGILHEKYYAAVARWIRVAPTVLATRRRKASGAQAVAEAMLELTSADLAALFAEPEDVSSRVLTLQSAYLLEPALAAELRARLRALLVEYIDRQVDAGEAINVSVFAYPPRSGGRPRRKRAAAG